MKIRAMKAFRLPEFARKLIRNIWVWNWVLVACGGAALFLKSFLLLGFIILSPYRFPALRTAYDWIPSIPVYLCFIAITLSPALLLGRKACRWYLLAANLIWSGIYISDLWYYRAFMRFTSVHHLRQTANLRNLSSAIISFIHPSDMLLLLDLALLIGALAAVKRLQFPIRRSLAGFFILVVLSSSYLAYYNEKYPINSDPLFEIRWNFFETIAAMSPIGYHLYDSFMFWSESRQLKLAPAERDEIKQWLAAQAEHLPQNKYKGLFRGNNLLLLQCESLENFVIGKSIGGQEITPNLNRLIGNSLYFKNFMEQVGDGTSADAEFINNTSIYALRSGAGSVSWRYPSNSYNSLPKLLARRGYRTIDIHPDPAAYWNWAKMMTGVGMMECVDAASFAQDELIDLGLSDGSFLRQSPAILVNLKQPFYAYMITLSNHGPYDLPPQLRELKLDQKFDKSEVGGYLQSVHYLDKHIGLFLQKLEAAGLLENTAIGIFGDHCGIHKFYEDVLDEMPESETSWMENGKRIPLIIYKKGIVGQSFDIFGGQIDLLPTIACLMGVEEREYESTAMGRNLLNTRRNSVMLYEGEYLASPPDKHEQERYRHGMKLADKIIRSDYFKANAFQESPQQK
jgi:lipoteichoic acid synthase